jgi:predicted nucleic acid-binding protein
LSRAKSYRSENCRRGQPGFQVQLKQLCQDGWKALQNRKPNTDLIPPALIVARYFAAEQVAIEQREAERDAISRQMEEMDEEHGGEDGLLNDARNDKGKLTKASVKARQAEIKRDKETADERKLLDAYADLIEQEAAAGKSVLALERRTPLQGSALRAWLTGVRVAFAGRILPFTDHAATLCAAMHVPNPHSERDAMIAATALEHGMTVVTRNVADFASTGVQLINPFMQRWPRKIGHRLK